MTKQELITLINSFGRLPGEYTEHEIYEIGKAHRELPQKDKNWNELALMIGYNGSGDNLRCFVKRRVLKENSISSMSISGDSLIDKDLYMQQVKIRDEMNAYRKTLRDEARVDTFKNMVVEAIKSLPQLPKVAYSARTRQYKSEAILLFSDLHIGVKCDNFYNSYNLEIATKRVNKLLDNTIEYCHRNNVKTLNICNLGDLIHGLIHVNARVEQEFDVINQVITASELIANFLNEIQVAAPQIIYRSVTDNHSRTMANKNEAIESENLSKLIDWYLQERLKDTKIIFANDNIDEGIGKFELSNGKKIMFAHGHNDSINQVYQHFTGASQEFIDYMLLGHYHCEKMKTYNSSRVFVNGSIVGTEQYALSKRLFSKPSQTLLIFEEDNLLNLSINLDIK